MTVQPAPTITGLLSVEALDRPIAATDSHPSGVDGMTVMVRDRLDRLHTVSLAAHEALGALEAVLRMVDGTSGRPVNAGEAVEMVRGITARLADVLDEDLDEDLDEEPSP